MRQLLLLISFCCLHIAEATAQKKKTFKINPGEKVVETIPKDEMYSYPEFLTGTVYLRNNTYSVAKMNYNSLFAEMQFINSKGDTLSLSDEKTIKLIAINTDTFYFDDGFLKLVLDGDKVKLANKQFFTFANRQKLGGLGEASNGSIDTYNTLSAKSYFKELVASEILTLAKNTIFYIGDRFSNFKIANKKNLLEMYNRNEQQVKDYLKEKKVDFSNEEDLKKMIIYFKSVTPI